MNKQIAIALLLFIQLTFSTTIFIPPSTLQEYSSVKNNTIVPNINPTALTNSKTQVLDTLQAQLNLIIKEQGNHINTSTYDKKRTNTRLLVLSENQTNNSMNTPGMIVQPILALMSPEVEPILSQEILDFVYQPTKITPKSKIYANITKGSKYSLSFNLIIVGSSKIDISTKLTATIQVNQNVTDINVTPGNSKHVIQFDGIVGSNEISVILKVEGKCKGFIYALLTNIEIVQMK